MKILFLEWSVCAYRSTSISECQRYSWLWSIMLSEGGVELTSLSVVGWILIFSMPRACSSLLIALVLVHHLAHRPNNPFRPYRSQTPFAKVKKGACQMCGVLQCHTSSVNQLSLSKTNHGARCTNLVGAFPFHGRREAGLALKKQSPVVVLPEPWRTAIDKALLANFERENRQTAIEEKRVARGCDEALYQVGPNSGPRKRTKNSGRSGP